MEEKKKEECPKYYLWIAVVLVVLSFIGGYLYAQKDMPKEKEGGMCTEPKKDKEPKDPSQMTEEEKKENREKQEKVQKPSHVELIEQTMNMKLVDRGLLKQFGVESRTVHIEKAGYIKDKPNVIYYTMYGKFKCKDGYDVENEKTCLYQPQLADPDEEGYYDYAFGITAEQTNNGEVFGDIVDPLSDTNPNAVLEHVLLK